MAQETIALIPQMSRLVEECCLTCVQQSGHLMEEEFEGKLSTYGDFNMVFVKYCI